MILSTVQEAKNELYMYNLAQFSSYESKVSNFYTLVQHVSDKVKLVNEALASTSSSVSVTIEDLRKIITTMGHQVEEVNDVQKMLLADDSTTAGGIAKLNQSVDILNGNYGGLFNTIFDLSGTVTYLQEQNTSVNTDISGIKTSVSANTTNLSNLTTIVNNNKIAANDGILTNQTNITNLRTTVTNNTTQLASQSKLLTITGMILCFAVATPPTGWLLCDGTSISRTTYGALFSVIGTVYGVGDGSTTFNLPDLRGRCTIGMGGGTNLSFRPLGSTGGEEAHLITQTELPSHTHGVNDPGHTHTVAYAVGSLNQPTAIGGSTTAPTTLKATSSSNTTGITLQNTGGGMAMNVMSPFIAMSYIIKT